MTRRAKPPLRPAISLAVAVLIPVIAAATVAGLYLTGEDDEGAAADPARLALGQQLYETHCASCHGADLRGEPNWQERRPDGTLPAPPQDETGHTWHHPDQQLFAITKHGIAAFAEPGYRSNMKGFGDVLSDDEIRAVLDYIKSRWPDEIRARQAEITRRAEES